MRRNFRALALAVTGGLLLVAPPATALATTPIPVTVRAPTERLPLSAQMLAFREHKANQSLADGFRGVGHPSIHVPATTTIDISSRYDGKKVPI